MTVGLDRLAAMLERLTEAGAPHEIVGEVAARFREPERTHGSVGRFVVASTQDVLVDEVVPQWVAPEVATYGPLPDVTAWLADKEDSSPVLVMRADKEGADLARYGSWDHDEPDEQRRVDGETHHLNKVPDGGIAMSDLQSHTEEVWRRNARRVATELDRMAGTSTPLIVLGGDPGATFESILGSPWARARPRLRTYGAISPRSRPQRSPEPTRRSSAPRPSVTSRWQRCCGRRSGEDAHSTGPDQ